MWPRAWVFGCWLGDRLLASGNRNGKVSLFAKPIEPFLAWGFWGSVLLLLHSYFVYPLLARLICRWQRLRCDPAQSSTPPNSEAQPNWPAISILVPAYNEGSVIAAKIENLVAMDYPADRIECLIFDDGSSDETVAVTEQALSDVIAQSTSAFSIRLIRGETRQGKATAVGRLAEQANHALWLLTDANVIMDAGALKQLAIHFNDPAVGAATGPVVLVGSGEAFQHGESLYYHIERSIQRAESLTGSVMGVDGGMYLIRRELVPPLPRDTILDDFTISMAVLRRGQRIIYCEQARATECGTVSAAQEFRRRVRIAAGAVQLIGRGWLPKLSQPRLWFRFTSHKLIRWGSPLLLALGTLALLGLGLSTDPAESSGYRWMAMLAVVGFAFAVIIALVPALQRSALGSVIHYLVLSQLAIGVGLAKGILHMQPPQWEKADRTLGSRP